MEDEANNLEIDSIKSIIKCVEDHHLAAEFPIESLRKKLTSLEKARADKKKASTVAGSKPPNKRGPASRGGARGSGPPPPHRPVKTPRFSSPYPQFGERNPLSPAQQSPLSRYSGPYSYPSQGTYDPGLSAPSCASSQMTPQHYTTIGDSHSGAESLFSGSYGGQVGRYGSYDYGAETTPHTYQPSS